MSQYTSSITGDVVANIRVINGNLYNLPSSNNYTQVTYYDEYDSDLTKPYYITPGKGLITKESLYIHNCAFSIILPNLTRLGSNFTLSLWIKVTNPPSRLSTEVGELVGITIRNTSNNSWSGLQSWLYQGAIDHQIYWHICSSEGGEKSYYRPNAIALNSVYHFAICKQGNSLYYFLNGSKIDTLETSGYFEISTINLVANRNATAFFDDVVVINNQVLWTNNFTVPNGPLLGRKHPRIDKHDYIYKMTDFSSNYFEQAYLY